MTRALAQAAEFPRYVAFVFRACGRRAGLRMLAATVAALPHIARTRTLRAVDAAMSRLCPTVVVDGRVTRWQRMDFGIFRDIVFRGVYTPTPAFVPQRGDTVVDLGANDGVFSVLAAPRVGDGRVIAVEAQPDECALIERHAAINDVAATVTVIRGFAGSGGVLDGMPGAAPSVDLDGVLDRVGIGEVALMKVDIEGSEFALFARPGRWLGRVRRIAMEAHPPHGDVRALCEILRAAGFAVWTQPSSTAAALYVYAERSDALSHAASGTARAAA